MARGASSPRTVVRSPLPRVRAAAGIVADRVACDVRPRSCSLGRRLARSKPRADDHSPDERGRRCFDGSSAPVSTKRRRANDLHRGRDALLSGSESEWTRRSRAVARGTGCVRRLARAGAARSFARSCLFRSASWRSRGFCRTCRSTSSSAARIDVEHAGGRSLAIPLPHPSGASSWIHQGDHPELARSRVAADRP